MKQIIVLAFTALVTSMSVHAVDDLEALYQSVIPKSSECYSAKLKNSAAVACNTSCGEAVVNLRLLVNGIPQPLPEKVKQQVSKCEFDYSAYAAATAGYKESQVKGVLINPESLGTVKNSKIQDQVTKDSYASLKTELAELEKVCANADQNRHSKNCVKFCNNAILELQKINTNDENIKQAMKNARGNVEKLPSVRQCRLRHKLATR